MHNVDDAAVNDVDEGTVDDTNAGAAGESSKLTLENNDAGNDGIFEVFSQIAASIGSFWDSGYSFKRGLLYFYNFVVIVPSPQDMGL